MSREPPVAPPAPIPASARRVITLSARRSEDLPALATRWSRWIAAHPDIPFDVIAATLLAGRPDEAHRWSWVAGDRDELVAGLTEPRHTSPAKGVIDGARVAFVVSGQGAALFGAASGWYGQAPAFTAALDEAEDLLVEAIGWGVRDVLLGRTDPNEAARPASSRRWWPWPSPRRPNSLRQGSRPPAWSGTASGSWPPRR